MNAPPLRSTMAAFMDDVDAAMNDELACVAPTADVADVVARAHAIDPRAVPSTWVATAAAIGGESDDEPPRREGSALSFFLAGVTEQLDDEIRTQRVAGRAAAGRPRLTRVVVAVLACAAAAGLALWAPTMVGAILERGESDRPAAGAQVVDRDATPDEATAREPSPDPRPARAEPTGEPAPVPAPPQAIAPASGRPSVRTLAELEAQAERAWRAGDLAGATAKYEEIVRRGGHSERAELAYGDLFTLALRASDEQRLASLWRRYLHRFPRGRYADDARAGTCRQAGRSTRRDCWQRYLADWPAGAHRSEARRHVD